MKVVNGIEASRRRLLGIVRRLVVRVDWLNRRLPWRVWCAFGASDAVAVAWMLARRAHRPLRFVQIGSNDGVVHDPIHLVVRTYGWTGVLVEPLPDLFARLTANYEGVPGLSFENVAIGEGEGTTTIFTIEPRPGDPYWVDQLASFDESTVRSHRDVLTDLDDRIVRTPVASVTLPGLVARHGMESIDLLHIDVEGYDVHVLEQIDFSASWAPSFIIYERQHLDRSTHRAARTMLRHAGYQWTEIWPDAFAFRTSPESM